MLAYPKYQPLTDYLVRQDGDQVTLSLRELEMILQFPLPVSARLRSWWVDTTLRAPHARAWRTAGWKVAAVNFGTQTVRFVRANPDLHR